MCIGLSTHILVKMRPSRPPGKNSVQSPAGNANRGEEDVTDC